MSVDELIVLRKQLPDAFRYSKTELWKRAFNEYNEDHPDDRPLHTSCRVCYYKVFKYLSGKATDDKR